jgi:hypothetical protein
MFKLLIVLTHYLQQFHDLPPRRYKEGTAMYRVECGFSILPQAILARLHQFALSATPWQSSVMPKGLQFRSCDVNAESNQSSNRIQNSG